MLCIILLFGTINTALIRSPLRRQRAQHGHPSSGTNTSSIIISDRNSKDIS